MIFLDPLKTALINDPLNDPLLKFAIFFHPEISKHLIHPIHPLYSFHLRSKMLFLWHDLNWIKNFKHLVQEVARAKQEFMETFRFVDRLPASPCMIATQYWHLHHIEQHDRDIQFYIRAATNGLLGELAPGPVQDTAEVFVFNCQLQVSSLPSAC